MKCAPCRQPMALERDPEGFAVGFVCPSCGAGVVMRDVGYEPAVGPAPEREIRFTPAELSSASDERLSPSAQQLAADRRASHVEAMRQSVIRRAAKLVPRACRYEPCGKTFQPTISTMLYCGDVCLYAEQKRRAQLKSKTERRVGLDLAFKAGNQ